MYFYCFLTMFYFIAFQLFFNLFKLKYFYLNLFLLLTTFYQLYVNLIFTVIEIVDFCIQVFISFNFIYILFIDHIFHPYFHSIINGFIFHLSIIDFLCLIYLFNIINFQLFTFTFKIQ